jgi:LysW-gamma-L-lysine carboxypeptidase
MSEPTQLLKQMLEIYSPSEHEEEIAIFLKEQLAELGFEGVRLDKEGNVFGEVGSGSPTVLLCGHMDTVPGRLPVKTEGDKIYGRGAVDAKSSLASMISAASKLIDNKIKGRLILAGVVDEEGKGRGIRRIVKDKLKVDYAVFGEPSGVSNITIGYKGRLEVNIICETKAGHSAAPSGFDNAIEKAFEVWNRVKTWSTKRPPRSPYYSTTACLTGILGGEASNIVPSWCALTVDVRLPLSQRCEKAVGELEAVMLSYRRENPEVGLEMRLVDSVEPFIAKKDSVLVKALTVAIEDTIGGPVRLLKKTGTGDMNIFANELKVPAVTYGPGNSRLSHTVDEYVEIEDYLASIEVYRNTVMNLFSID